MTRFAPISLVALVAASPALAQLTLGDVDITGDNFASFEEMKIVLPGLHMEAFQEMDANGDNRLSSSEMNELRAQEIMAQHPAVSAADRSTKVLDADSDGFISFEDVARVYPTFSKLSFEEVDSNGDNRLSYSEYYTPAMQSRIAACQGSKLMDLASFDTDGNRFIDISEFQAVMPGISGSDFRVMDTNDDNRVSANELMASDAQCVLGAHGS